MPSLFSNIGVAALAAAYLWGGVVGGLCVYAAYQRTLLERPPVEVRVFRAHPGVAGGVKTHPLRCRTDISDMFTLATSSTSDAQPCAVDVCSHGFDEVVCFRATGAQLGRGGAATTTAPKWMCTPTTPSYAVAMTSARVTCPSDADCSLTYELALTKTGLEVFGCTVLPAPGTAAAATLGVPRTAEARPAAAAQLFEALFVFMAGLIFGMLVCIAFTPTSSKTPCTAANVCRKETRAPAVPSVRICYCPAACAAWRNGGACVTAAL